MPLKVVRTEAVTPEKPQRFQYIEPVVTQTFPLEEADFADQMVDEHTAVGRAVLIM